MSVHDDHFPLGTADLAKEVLAAVATDLLPLATVLLVAIVVAVVVATDLLPLATVLLVAIVVAAVTGGEAVRGKAGARVLLLAVMLIFTLVPTKLGLETMARAGFLSSDLPGSLTGGRLPLVAAVPASLAGGLLVVVELLQLFMKLAAWVSSSCRCFSC